jgi:ribonuclease-3
MPAPSDDASLRAALTPLLGLDVRRLALYRQALTHRSLLRERPSTDAPSYERLEFLGDALLDLVVSEGLMEAFPDADEGFLSKLRAKLVSGAALARCARRLGLSEHLRVGANARRAGVHHADSVLADAFEALCAAVYLDHGLDAARTFAQRAALDAVDLDAVAARSTNYKSRLLERMQALGRSQPTYRVVEATGPSHDKTFTVEALLDGTPRGTGTAGSKKAAEQHAAREALAYLAEQA